MAKANRTCYACGKGYYYCPTCDNTGETWQIMFDCEECQKAFMVASDYNYGAIDASIAKDRLLEIPNFKIENYRESIQKIAKEVLALVPSDEINKVVDTSVIEKVEITKDSKEEDKETTNEEISVVEETPVVEEIPVIKTNTTTVNQSKKKRYVR